MAVSREELLKFLNKKTRADLSKLDDDTELFSSTLIDSFAMVELLQWLEKDSGSRVDYGSISIEDLDTVERILAFSAKLSG